MKKKTLTTISSLGALGGVALIATSCGTSAAKLKDGLIADIQHDGKTISEVAFDKFYNQLVANGKSEDAKKIQDIVKKSAKFLYEEEVKGSEFIVKIREAQMSKKEKKDANLQPLKSISKIEKSVKAEFADQKEAFMEAHGHGYEEAWKTELSSNKTYGNATSDKQAIDNMVLKQLVSNAYARYTISKDSDTFTKADVERGNPKPKNGTADKNQKDWKWLWDLKEAGYVFSTDKSSTYDKIEKTQKVIVVSTGSQVVTRKNPEELMGGKNKDGTLKDGYLNKFDPMVVNHFLLPVIPDAKKALVPWKVKIDDVKKMLMSIEPPTKNGKPNYAKPALDNIVGFKGLQYNKVNKKGIESNKSTGDDKALKFGVTETDEILLKISSGNKPGTQSTGGSLGMMDELSYVKSMDPGFGLPLLNNEIKIKNDQFEIMHKNPLEGLAKTILTALQKEVDGSSWVAKNLSSLAWADKLDKLFDAVNDDAKVTKIVGRVFRDAFSKGNLAATNGNNSKERYLAYEIEKEVKDPQGNVTTPARYLVTSKFGIHIISKRKIMDKKMLGDMLKSDVTRTTKGDSAYFNVISEINKFSSDKMLITKSLLNNKDFTKWLKSQPNYNGKAVGNDYPNYTEAVINKLRSSTIAGYEHTLAETRASAAITNIRPWVDAAFHDEILTAGNFGNNLGRETDFWNASLESIYDTAVNIASEGAVHEIKKP